MCALRQAATAWAQGANMAAMPEQRQEMYVKLEQDLLSQIKMCQANRLYFKSTGEVASMNKFQVCMFYLFLERFFNFY